MDNVIKRLFRLSTLSILFLNISCAEEARQVTGAELLAPFKKELSQALHAGMENGVDEAINVCKRRAPEIAASHSINGVRMGRTSDRLRNPGNTAPEWVQPILENYLKNSQDRVPKTSKLENSRSGYAEPIMIQPLCLSCHGASLAPETQRKISLAYPDDMATGYELGELRGVFWVEYGN